MIRLTTPARRSAWSPRCESFRGSQPRGPHPYGRSLEAVMRLCFRISCALLLLLTLSGSSAALTTIEVDQSPLGDTCYLPIVNGPGAGRFYILVRLGDLPGITGAEFRLTGMPPELSRTLTPNPAANIVLGDPFDTGCNIAFPACQVGTGGIVRLFTVDFVVPTSGITPFILQVERRPIATDPVFPCPLVTLCDEP